MAEKTVRMFRYRLYPRKAEVVRLEAVLDQTRWVYNQALEMCNRRFSDGEKYSRPDRNPTRAIINDLRKMRFPDLPFKAMDSALQKLHRTHENFFRSHKDGGGKPKFKGRDFWSSFSMPFGGGVYLDWDEKFGRYLLRITRVSDRIKIKMHRPIPEQGAIKTATIKREAGGWYVSFAVELPYSPGAPNGLDDVGADLGIKTAVTLSDGNYVDSPRFLRDGLDELRRSQRVLSRRKKGSKRRRKARAKVALWHYRVANRRRHFWDVATYQISRSYGLVAMGDLKKSFMFQNGKLSRAASDIGLGMFEQRMAYKGEDAGCEVVKVDEAYTTQECSECGALVPKTLKDRVHRCPQCGLVMDRDVNAARNILEKAREAKRGENQAKQPSPSRREE